MDGYRIFVIYMDIVDIHQVYMDMVDIHLKVEYFKQEKPLMLHETDVI